MSQEPQVDIQALWRYVTEQVKNEVTLPSLWRAMEAAKPIIVENEEVVIGFGPEVSNLQGLLMDGRNRNTVDQIMERATRRRLRLRVIDGDTLDDWEAAKAKDAAALQRSRDVRAAAPQAPEGAATWEALCETLVRRFTATPNRMLASVQGRFLEEAVDEIVGNYQRLMPENPSEMEERQYTRCLERLGERVGLPGTMLAFVISARRRGKG